MDWAAVLGQLAGNNAPLIGRIAGQMAFGGPGAELGSMLGKMIAGKLGVEATPEAVNNVIQTNPQAAAQAAQEVETEHGEDIEALLKDRQDARATMLASLDKGSKIAWAPSIISLIVVVGFIAMASVAMFHPSGADPGIVLFVLGSMNAAFAAVLQFWLGSSSSSQKKDNTISAFVSQASVIKPPVR